jgi:Coenzyme PQQ synthesis protein D (PqqD)
VPAPYFGLNGVGNEIWSMLAEPHRVGQICDTLAQFYDIDRDTMTRDVTSFLQALVERRLLREVAPGERR